MNDQVLNAFFSIQTVVFCVVVYTIVQIVRTTLENIFARINWIMSDKVKSFLVDFWNVWFLPAAPIITGFLFGWLVGSYPYPDPFVKTVGGRMFFGIVAGGASGYVYRFFRFYVKKVLPPDVSKKLDGVLGPIPSLSPKEAEEAAIVAPEAPKTEPVANVTPDASKPADTTPAP